MITNFPSQLGAEDIEDFCALAQYYAVRSPTTYRKVSDQVLHNDFFKMFLQRKMYVLALLYWRTRKWKNL